MSGFQTAAPVLHRNKEEAAPATKATPPGSPLPGGVPFLTPLLRRRRPPKGTGRQAHAARRMGARSAAAMSR